LHYAARSGLPSVVSALLASGAIQDKNGAGATPKDLAMDAATTKVFDGF